MTLPFDKTDHRSPADTLVPPTTPGAFEYDAVSLQLTPGRTEQRLGQRIFLTESERSL